MVWKWYVPAADQPRVKAMTVEDRTSALKTGADRAAEATDARCLQIDMGPFTGCWKYRRPVSALGHDGRDKMLGPLLKAFRSRNLTGIIAAMEFAPQLLRGGKKN